MNRSTIRHKLHETAHHLAVALIVASTIFVVEHAGLLNWLESVSLRLVSELTLDGATKQVLAESESLQAPVAVSIGPAMYESYFQQRSPLSRTHLAQVIDAIAAHQPTTLVIDIDVSPTLIVDDAPGQERLDSVIGKLAATGATRIVLSTPMPSISERLIESKHAWMARLCQTGVAFGYPYLPVTQGLVMRYLRGGHSLADIALNVRSEAAHRDNTAVPCKLVAQGPHKAAFLGRDFPFDQFVRADNFREQVPISANTIAEVKARQIVLDDIGQIEALHGLKGRVVYLGGGPEDMDLFATVVGRVSGLILHAAGYAAMQTPVSAVSHGLAFGIDLLIGTIAGFLFHSTWTRYNSRAKSLAQAHAWSWKKYGEARLSLLVSFLALGIVLWAVFFWSGWLLTHNLWNNPGPMLLGVFIKTIIGSRSELFGGGHASTDDHADHRSGLLDMALLSPFVILAIYWLLFSGH